MRTLTIDIGGTGIKTLLLDREGAAVGERQRELTPHPSTPKAVLAVLDEMVARRKPFDRVSVGFPGVVKHGRVLTAPNLGTKHWAGFELQAAITNLTGSPVRVINDAELQGFGVIDGVGVELVLTLGTGLGTGLYVDGRLVPNLELGHHPFKSKRTYEDLVSDSELERVGEKKWRKRMRSIVKMLDRIFNYDRLHIGGGNAEHLEDPLPENVRRFTNVEGMAGGVRLWRDSQQP